MKKWLIGLFLLLLILTLIILYLLIPSPIRIAGRVDIKTSLDGAYRKSTQQETWDSIANGTISLTEKRKNSFSIVLKPHAIHSPIDVLLVPMANDSIALFWETTLPTIKNPVAVYRQYFQALQLKKNMESILVGYRNFMENKDNLYGMPLREKTTDDTLLAATSFHHGTYPSTENIYSHIKKLKDYLAGIGAKETGKPMLNVTQLDSADYKCTVALPINTSIDGNGDVFFIRMVPFRKFVTVKVTGGVGKVQHAHEMLALYFSEFSRTSMAIPFEYLITDRLQQSDSTKWETEIFEAIR